MSEDVEETKFEFWASADSEPRLFNLQLIEGTCIVDNHKMPNCITSPSDECCLVLSVPPENRFRYRYDTEMSGTHGSLQGMKTGKKKSFPTVTLLNYSDEALIRVTLVTCQKNEEPYPHPHSIFVREKLYQKKIYENRDGKRPTKTGHMSDPHYIRVSKRKNDHTARFEGMCIINSKKENFYSSVRDKIRKKFKEGESKTFVEGVENEVPEALVEKAVRSVDVDFVRLCFEAFREDEGKLYLICPPVYSEPIGNAKSAKTGQLKISRINKCSGSCKGGDEIWMLVEKINKKGLVVRFWEECNGKTVWQSSLEGDDLILHHQYAIIFKTPAYRDVNLLMEAEIFMRLERVTEPDQPCDYSEPITFVYEPSRKKPNKGDSLHRKESILAPLEQIHIKRPRTDSSFISFSHEGNRSCEDLEFENMNLEDSTEGYIEQILFSDKDSVEFDQAWAKFNVEEFLQFLSSDDVEMPLQRDGIFLSGKQYRDLLYKIYMLYSKVDENDIKKLTDDVSNFRVSKKENEMNHKSRSVVEKDQVKDAASTLLSLRSKAMANTSACSANKKIEKSNSNTGNSSNVNFNSEKSEIIREPNLNVPQSVRTSVIRNNTKHLPIKNNPLSNTDDCEKLSFNDRSIQPNKSDKFREEEMVVQTIKKEMDNSCNTINLHKLNILCDVLNEGGSWKNLAEIWNCDNAISEAQTSSNPAKYIFEYARQIHGEVDTDMLRQLLQAIQETKALEILEEMLV